MMDHKEILELLPAYVDQELGISDTLAVERHLGGCSDCQREYAEQRTVKARLRKDAVCFDAPAHLAERITERINAALPQDGRHSARSKYRNVNWFNAGAAMAALLAAAWSIGLYLNLPSAQERLAEEVISSHVRSLQVDHLSDVASSDQHTVKPWFNGKLNFSPPVVDLAPQGFPLAGGRLDYLDGRPVAVLIYRHNRHPINLYIWPSTGKDAAPQVQERQGYYLVRWTSDGMDYWAISDLAANELKNFAEIVRSAVRK
jgi:anti-sigma factor RsiW